MQVVLIEKKKKIQMNRNDNVYNKKASNNIKFSRKKRSLWKLAKDAHVPKYTRRKGSKSVK